MKKIWLSLLAFFVVLSFTLPAFARSHDVPTIAAYTSNTLVKRGDWKIHRITFTATANGGNFGVYDVLTAGAITAAGIKTEGSEATSLNSTLYDFTGNPIEGSTGLFLEIVTGTALIEYE